MDITAASYGKSDVDVLLRTGRAGASDAVVQLTFTISVEGAFLDSYRHGDNSDVLPSDTLRRHALAVCAERDGIGDVSLHGLVEQIGRRVLAANPAFTTATVAATRTAWSPVGRHTFVDGRRPTTATAVVTPTSAAHGGAVADLRVLLTTGSAFTGFLRDGATVQSDAADRPLSGTLSASWSFAAGVDAAASASPDDVVDELLAALADRPSNSVQQWLTAAAGAVLDTIAPLASLTVRLGSIPITAVAAPAGDAPVHTFELAATPVGVTTVTLAH